MRPLLISAVFLFGCSDPPATEAPQPGPLRAGVAVATLDVPVGTPSGGYGRSMPSDDPGSPWADAMPASRGVHFDVTARALALSDGLKTVVLVSTDLPLTTASLRARAQRAAGDVQLVIAATHSHAAPGRFFMPTYLDGSAKTDVAAQAMDTYSPELEQRLARSIVDAARSAVAAMKPAAVGHATAELSELNSDRRCENDELYGADFRDRRMTVIRIDEVDDAGAPVRPMAAVLHYAMHGTVSGSANTLLSGDAPGAMALAASDALGVPVLYLQGSAGDVSPAGGELGHSGPQRVERIGVLAAPKVADAFAQAAPSKAPERAKLQLLERRSPITREAIGYARGEFAAQGAVGCIFAAGACGLATPPDQLTCIPLAKTSWTQGAAISALQLEDLLLLTLPGEPTTGFGQKIEALAATRPGISRALVVGYAQDHYGYLLEQDDFLRGGYEPTVSPWGYRFDPFLRSEMSALLEGLDSGAEQPLTPLPETVDVSTAAMPYASAHAPAISEQPQTAQRLATARFAFWGGDPGLGTPRVALERLENGTWVPVFASPSRAIVNGPELVLRYQMLPAWKGAAPDVPREHLWTAEWETLPNTATGSYRLVATGRAEGGDYRLESGAFEVTASTACGTIKRARFEGDRLLVELRLPPNDTEYRNGGDPLRYFRLRDPDARPTDGVRCAGGTMSATVTAPSGATAQRSFSWDPVAEAWSATEGNETGQWKIDLAPGGIVDVDGNTNAAALSLTAAR